MTDPRLSYQTIEFDSIDIHVCTLRDNQEFHDPDGVAENLGISSATWPLFGVIWPSSQVLAHHLLDVETGSARILEIGCGIALCSLLLNRLGADITATDHHPEVEKFLQRNTELNGDPPIAFEMADWVADSDNLGLFDLIIGSDLLYEPNHAELLCGFITRHAKPSSRVIIVDPGRGNSNHLCTRLTAEGFSLKRHKPEHTDYLEKPFTGIILEFAR